MSPRTAITIREADTIWREEGGWFDARWHFSFDRYRDPEQMGVGALDAVHRPQQRTRPDRRAMAIGRHVTWK